MNPHFYPRQPMPDRFGPAQGHAFALGHLVISLLFLAAFVILTVWVVKQLTRTYQTTRQASQVSSGTIDPALDEVRKRYARGDISREDFMRISEDLQASRGPLTG